MSQEPVPLRETLLRRPDASGSVPGLTGGTTIPMIRANAWTLSLATLLLGAATMTSAAEEDRRGHLGWELAAYRQQLDAVRREHGGVRTLPPVAFFLFGEQPLDAAPGATVARPALDGEHLDHMGGDVGGRGVDDLAEVAERQPVGERAGVVRVEGAPRAVAGLHAQAPGDAAGDGGLGPGRVRVPDAAQGEDDFGGVVDIATAQWVFERLGKLSRINLRLATGSSPELVKAALADLLPDPPEAARLHRAQAPVQRPLVIEGQPAPEIGPLDERGPKPARGRVVRGEQPVNTAADDQHVVLRSGERVQVSWHGLGHL